MVVYFVSITERSLKREKGASRDTSVWRGEQEGFIYFNPMLK